MHRKKICAGIVTYNPDIERLRENICAVLPQVSKVYIVDNASENIGQIENLIRAITSDIVVIKNNANEGIACALNQLIDAAKCEYEWILTLDQDSVVYKDLIAKYTRYMDIDDAGMICCNIVDRNFSSTQGKRNDKDIWVVKKCITSGTLTNIKGCIISGGFEDSLFIDSVDYDMCYSMQEHGYKVYQIKDVGLLHEVGKSTGVKFGKIGFAVNNHPAWRKYYISRNSVYMIYKHKLNPIIEYFYVYRRIFTVLFFESDKRKKITAILNGIRDGKRMGKGYKKK